MFVSTQRSDPSIRHVVQTVITGVMSLLFRQTNVFWVAVFPAGLAVIESLKEAQDKNVKSNPTLFQEVLTQSWKHGLVHDVSIERANLQGMQINSHCCSDY